MAKPRKSSSKKREKRVVSRGRVYIHATFNNTIVTITDRRGGVIAWGSAGTVGFKGSRKSTPYAARLAADTAGRSAVDMGLQEVDIFIKGPGPGRESAIRAIQGLNIAVNSITDRTPVPHNGCRPPKKRRV
jgi:small subunit ribosomal protein S11